MEWQSSDISLAERMPGLRLPQPEEGSGPLQVQGAGKSVYHWAGAGNRLVPAMGSAHQVGVEREEKGLYNEPGFHMITRYVSHLPS